MHVHAAVIIRKPYNVVFLKVLSNLHFYNLKIYPERI
jgi:hypothetical protein